MSTTITGTLVELRDRFLVLEGPTYINVPPDLTVDDLAIGERIMITVKSEGRRWTVERIERYPG